MEIIKEELEEKRKILIEEHKRYVQVLNEATIILHKLEGGIEILNDLLKPKKPEIK